MPILYKEIGILVKLIQQVKKLINLMIKIDNTNFVSLTTSFA